MKKATLVVREDHATGETGFMVKGTPQMSGYPMVATDGLLVAHDLLEHPNGVAKIGSVDDELEALGGIMFVRGWTGQVRGDSIHSVEDNLSADLYELARVYIGGVDFRSPVPKNTRRTEYDDTFEAALNKALIDVTGEFDWLEGTEDADDIRARSRFFRQWALPYMRKGVVKSKRRFARYSQSEVHGTFWAIARAVDHALRDGLWHGRELTLRYDIQRCHAEVTDEYDYDEL